MRSVGQIHPICPPHRDSVALRFAPAWSILVAAIVLSGCAAPASEPVSPGPRRDLAATPEPLEPEETATVSPATSASQGPTTSAASSPTTASTSSSSSSPAPPAFRSRSRVTDPSGDTGLQAPDYADLVSVLIESDGRDVRVTVDVADDLPTPLADGEVMGIGIDFYADANAQESQYQLFADGGVDGWFAYLQTPEGFIEYPGSFRLGGGRLVFQVPMWSLGGLKATAASGFLDWSQAGALVNVAASDSAPDSGRARIDP